ncbi:MAG: TRAP transporter small permease subunit [Proteobacteria bacterium]|nr:TRAP transporter small permease subunit [Pseudomonadota bacterium]
MKVLEKYINFVGEKISQELVMYFHALVFLGCAGYVMNHDEHVRVDIFYRNASQKYKKNINFIFGLVFLLPLIAITFFYSIETIEASWKMSEASTEAGGLAYVYIQKTLMILFPLTLLAALINQFIKTKWK